MLKLRVLRPRRYWETLTDDQLLRAELKTDDPEGLDNLLRELPAGYEDSYVEYKYDLRGSGRQEFCCVHGHHRHLAGFVMRKDEVRWLVGWQCAKAIYGEDFDQYKADFNTALNRQETLRKRREIASATEPFVAWLELILQSDVLKLFESVRSQIRNHMPWIWENAPFAATFGMALGGVKMPPTLFEDDTNPQASFARIVAEMSALKTTLIDKEELKEEGVRKIKRVLEGLIPKAEVVLNQLQEVVDFFQPAVLTVLCRLGNEHDNPRKRKYIADLLSITCKRGREKTTVQLPRNYRVPNSDGLVALKEVLRVL
jgi:hypothetical protein